MEILVNIGQKIAKLACVPAIENELCSIANNISRLTSELNATCETVGVLENSYELFSDAFDTSKKNVISLLKW